MAHCLWLGRNLLLLWSASRSAHVKKINHLCFSLSIQRLISDQIDLDEDDSTWDSIYIKSLRRCAHQQAYLQWLIDSISIYFQTIQQHHHLTCQLSLNDRRDLLSLIIFMSEIIYINLIYKNIFLSSNLIKRFFHCLIKRIFQSTSLIYQWLIAFDQILSCSTLARTIPPIFYSLY